MICVSSLLSRSESVPFFLLLINICLYHWFNPATFLCLSQARTWIFPEIVVVSFVFIDLRWNVFVHFLDIGGIAEHYCFISVHHENRIGHDNAK